MTADGLSDPPAGRRASLGRRLVWRLVLAQVGIQILVVALLFVTGNLVEFSSQENTVEILQEAVARDASGALVLRDTPRLRGLRAEQPDLWAVLRDGQGRELRDGPVPPEFAAVGGALDGVGQARLGWNLGDPPRHGADAQGRDRGGARGRDGASQFDHGAQCADRGGPGPVEDGVADRVDDARGDAAGHHLVVRRTLGGLRARPSRPVASTSIVAKRDCPWATCRKKPPRWCGRSTARWPLDEGYARHQRFLADAAHELRTPIAILNMRLEALPAGPERARLLEDAARLSCWRDNCSTRSGWSATARRCCRWTGRAGARRHGGAGAAGRWRRVPDRIRVGAGPVTVAGDRPALERAVSNLVQNAIQHGGRRGVITLRVHGVRAVEVCDRATACRRWREDIFKPFVKESPHSTGAGLGLNRWPASSAATEAKFPWRPGRTAAPAFALIFPSRRRRCRGRTLPESDMKFRVVALRLARCRSLAREALRVLAWPAILCAGLAGTSAALATASPMFWFNLVYLGVVLLIRPASASCPMSGPGKPTTERCAKIWLIPCSPRAWRS